MGKVITRIGTNLFIYLFLIGILIVPYLLSRELQVQENEVFEGLCP